MLLFKIQNEIWFDSCHALGFYLHDIFFVEEMELLSLRFENERTG